MTLRRRTMMTLGTCSLAAGLFAGCAEEGNEEYFQRTAPPGTSGPEQSYSAGNAGQAAPGGGGAPTAPKGESEPSGEVASEAPAPAPPEAPAAPSAPAPDDTSKG